MKTKYLLFSTAGRRDVTLEKVKSVVRLHELSNRVPLVKFEKGKGHEFYMGIGIVSEGLNPEFAPSDIVSVFRPILGEPLSRQLVDRSEIARMMSGDVEWKSFNRKITFEQVDESEIPQPNYFQLDEETLGQQLEINDELDLLLIWLNSSVSGSYKLFRDVCVKLSIVEEGKSAWPILRKLVLLGYLEIDDSQHSLEWGIVPPVLVGCSMDEEQFFVAGSWSAGSIDGLKKSFTFVEYTDHISPTRFFLQSACIKRVSDLFGAKIVPSAAENLCDILPSYLEWINSLHTDPDVSLHNYSFEKFNGNVFQGCMQEDVSVGFYRVTRMEGFDCSPKLVFNDGSNWKRAGFYDLRFAYFSNQGRKLKAFHNKHQTLSIPVEYRWPFLYERCLVLASGRTPKITRDSNGHSYIHYPEIPLGLCESLSNKLGVSFEVT